jgi:hypothetical protein
MLRALLVAMIGGALGALAAGGPGRAPVLVELFTSEGCSSCPPADRLLEQLDGRAIVLSEHVDYWDRLGWRDPYSSHANTLRQEAYARVFSTQGPYTPQMVIDGAVEFVGNDARRAEEEVARAREKVGVRLTRTAAGVEVEIDAGGHGGDVMLAVALDSGSSQVAAGENAGRKLHHVAMVQSLRKIGSVKKGAGFRQVVEVAADAGRVIAFVQDNGLGRVYGVGMLAR